MAQAADFFVSYTSADRAWAEWIAWQLEAEGYQVVIEAWDFRPGNDFVQQMHQVAQEAKRTIAALSPTYLDSAFGGAEWRAAFAGDPTGEQGLLLPVRVGKVDPPGLLKNRVYVDLVDKDAASARTALLAAALWTRGKPTAEPEFPGAPGHPGGSGARAPWFPGELENQIPHLEGVHQWVWPREHGSSQSRNGVRPSTGTVKLPTPPPLDAVQATLVGWAREQRLMSPSMFEGQLTVRDATIVRLLVAAAFDERRETLELEHPGPPPGQPEIYDGSLQHARLSIDYGDRKWQNTSDWHGVRRDFQKQDCPACKDGTVNCQICHGSGKFAVQPPAICPDCHGQRFFDTVALIDGDMELRKYRCPSCDGTGTAGPIPCPNDCSEGRFSCPRCMGHRYLTSFYRGELKRHAVPFGIRIPDNDDLRRVTEHYELVRQTIGWPDLSDLPQDVQRDMIARLEEFLTRMRNDALGRDSVVYHLETQLSILPAVQVPYDRDSKRAYLIGRHWEVYAPYERRPGVRLTRAWVAARSVLRARLDRNSSPGQRAWPILLTLVGFIFALVVLLLMVKLITRR